MFDANSADTNMHSNLLIWLGLIVLLFLLLGGPKMLGIVTKALRTSSAMKSIIHAYRAGDYGTALKETERLRNGQEKTGEYCFMRGGMLHHLGRLDESEACL